MRLSRPDDTFTLMFMNKTRFRWIARHRAAAMLASVLGGIVITGCSTGPRTGEIRAAVLDVPRCLGKHGRDGTRHFEPFVLELNFFGFERFKDFDDIVRIKMQNGQRRNYESDGLILDIPNANPLEAMVAASGQATLPVSQGFRTDYQMDEVRASLFLNRTCKSSSTPLTIQNGTVTFSRFQNKRGGHVQGMIRGDVIDARTKDLLAKDIEVDFDFTIRTGTPFQPFTPF